MGTYRFPILLWKDPQGYHTACLVEGGEPAGFGRRADDAKDQLEEFLTWSLQEDSWALGAADFQDARLVEYQVPVRPEYREHHRVYLCQETLRLRVPCVLGKQKNGLLVCALPTLGIHFYYHSADAL